MLAVAFDGIQERFFFQIRQLKPVEGVERQSTQKDMQYPIDKFGKDAAYFSLKINIKETEYLYQPVKLVNLPPKTDIISINNNSLASWTDFKYLGSTVSSHNKIDTEIVNKIGRASIAFAKRQDRLRKNKHVSINVKCKVYRLWVLSTLLYGAETWTIPCYQVKKLSPCVTWEQSWASHKEKRLETLIF